MLPRPDARVCEVVLDTLLSLMAGVIARRELLWLAKSIAWPYRWLATPGRPAPSFFLGQVCSVVDDLRHTRPLRRDRARALR